MRAQQYLEMKNSMKMRLSNPKFAFKLIFLLTFVSPCLLNILWSYPFSSPTLSNNDRNEEGFKISNPSIILYARALDIDALNTEETDNQSSRSSEAQKNKTNQLIGGPETQEKQTDESNDNDGSSEQDDEDGSSDGDEDRSSDGDEDESSDGDEDRSSDGDEDGSSDGDDDKSEENEASESNDDVSTSETDSSKPDDSEAKTRVAAESFQVTSPELIVDAEVDKPSTLPPSMDDFRTNYSTDIGEKQIETLEDPETLDSDEKLPVGPEQWVNGNEIQNEENGSNGSSSHSVLAKNTVRRRMGQGSRRRHKQRAKKAAAPATLVALGLGVALGAGLKHLSDQGVTLKSLKGDLLDQLFKKTKTGDFFTGSVTKSGSVTSGSVTKSGSVTDEHEEKSQGEDDKPPDDTGSVTKSGSVTPKTKITDEHEEKSQGETSDSSQQGRTSIESIPDDKPDDKPKPEYKEPEYKENDYGVIYPTFLTDDDGVIYTTTDKGGTYRNKEAEQGKYYRAFIRDRKNKEGFYDDKGKGIYHNSSSGRSFAKDRTGKNEFLSGDGIYFHNDDLGYYKLTYDTTGKPTLDLDTTYNPQQL